MLTVWCVFVGDKYPIQAVYNLKKMVSKNIDCEYRFKCISDRLIPMIDTVPAALGLPGWWQKLALFYYADGPSIYFDIDTVITGKIDRLLPYTKHTLSMAKNWSQSGHGGWQSSCMCWDGTLKKPFSEFKHEAIDRLWGDQEYLTEILGDFITEIESGLICSYKYHCKGKLPPECVASTFHGKPDYWECKENWIKQALL